QNYNYNENYQYQAQSQYHSHQKQTHYRKKSLQPRPYIGGDISRVAGEVSGGDYRVSALGLRVGADIGEYFGAEIRGGLGLLDDDFTVLGSTQNAELNYYAAALGKVQTPSLNGFRLYGLLGIAHIEMTYSTFGGSQTDTDTGLAYGIGTSYDLNHCMALSLEYLQFGPGEVDYDILNLGINYKF
ncbi:MAG: porin family protein, partial [Pseudomonadota bacterium]